MYAIDIDFNGAICHLKELTKFLRQINWRAVNIGVTIYYSSYSKVDIYDFEVVSIDHEKKWALLTAINNGGTKLIGKY